MSTPLLTSAHLFDVKGKTVLVTGGSSGIGKNMAQAFIMSGAKVYIAARKLPQLQEAAAELNALGKASGGSCFFFVADLKDKAGCDALAAQMKEKETKLDVLVNNSGATWGSPLTDTPEKNGWDKIMELNVKSIFYLTAALLPVLTKDVDNISPGRVINITSVAGSLATAEGNLASAGTGTYSYAASKAAANHLTKILAASLARKHITVNAIAPGVFPSRMTRFGINNQMKELLADQPTGRLGMAEDIGGIALFLSSRASSHITGSIIPVDGGSTLGVAKL
ncbi:putative NADPH-dependent beta-ketoacyl reductase [Mrakia frigida]|uniref:putative NADPH-dependent beta-ketoacyl reductase n=1 Tax=Mrakia frigida TaxID=29902 RepID=UPI003FCC0C79